MKINVCSIGDPNSPKTWSGTSRNILDVLKKEDRVEMTFYADQEALKSKAIQFLSMLYYKTFVDRNRGKFIRHAYGRSFVKKTAESKSKHTLHVGTCCLPAALPKDQHHYFYCDFTWNLWSSQATNMGKYSNKLINDAEKVEYETYKNLDHIFSISEFVKANLINHYHVPSEKITVVGTGTGVIKPFFGTKDYSNGKILFAAKGRFKDKGGDIVLKAFEKALTINPNLQLSIVGQNDYTGLIDHPNIKTYGFIPIEELQDLFNTHSLFLMPALNEPWGLVYLEALACKMPIIGLNRNSFPELSGHGGYGFGINEADPDILAECLAKALSDIPMLQNMAEKGQQNCLSNFTWDNTVEKIISKIEDLASVKVKN
ncbi:glycosyltransferase family 4 protein [Mucilaginibacter sp. PAMB04274]|uniref:glycosyltransferase family 4 protein n=1 Tax=Mucilaginibacter sp. PAMB04274 TaxID=3138568 RepID=UPI0031F67116